jgi:hypothetical protein
MNGGFCVLVYEDGDWLYMVISNYYFVQSYPLMFHLNFRVPILSDNIIRISLMG